MRSSRVPAPALRRELELDFIRGIAILMVMDFHSPYSLLLPVERILGFKPLGALGVDLFFVLSGFLVGGLLMKEWKVRKGIDSTRFLIRRGFKIWPQYYCFLAVVLLSGRRTFHELIGNLLNVQNYTAQGISHTWSLAVEEHTYLLLTLCFAVAARRKVRLRSLFLFLCGVCVFESGFRYWLLPHGHLVFLPTHARLDSITYGVLLAMLYHFAPEKFAKLSAARWLWALLFLLALAILRPSGVPVWGLALQHDGATLFAVSLVMLLYRPVRDGRQHRWPYRAVAWVGLYSYGIYLWHVSLMQPIVTFAAKHAAVPQPAVIGALVLAQIAVGYATTRLIEFPALRLRDRVFPRRVDTPVGTPAEFKAADPASAHL